MTGSKPKKGAKQPEPRKTDSQPTDAGTQLPLRLQIPIAVLAIAVLAAFAFTITGGNGGGEQISGPDPIAQGAVIAKAVAKHTNLESASDSSSTAAPHSQSQQERPECPRLNHIQLPQDIAIAPEILRQAALDHQPVVVHNDLSSEAWQQLKQNWSIPSLTRLLGDTPLQLTEIADGIHAQFGFLSTSSMEASRFLSTLDESEALHSAAGSRTSQQLRDLALMQPNPAGLPVSDSVRDWSPLVSIGGKSSGLAFHSQSHMWLTVVEGYTQWLLYPPGSMPQKADLGDWLNFMNSSRLVGLASEGYLSDRQLYSCTLAAGDTIYVPSGWMRATVNLHPRTVATGFQQSSPFDEQLSELSTKFPESGMFASQTARLLYKAKDYNLTANLLVHATKLEPHNFRYVSDLLAFLLAEKRATEALKIADDAAAKLEDLVKRKLVVAASASWVISNLAMRFNTFGSKQADQSEAAIFAYALVVKLLMQAQKLDPLSKTAQATLDQVMEKAGFLGKTSTTGKATYEKQA